MKMTCRLAIRLVFFFSLFSCSGNKKELKVSEKDIEGYWVSGYLLHNTELTRTIASDNKKEPQVQLLRLKNSVNGFPDTSYILKGNILIYRTEFPVILDKGLQAGGALKVFLITFISKDRLILKDIKTLEETTYYNLNMVAESKGDFEEISFGPYILMNDSGAFNRLAFPFYSMINDSVSRKYSFKNTKIDDRWREDVNFLVRRINWNAALFLQGSTIPKTEKLGEFVSTTPEGRRFHLGIKTAKYTGEWKLQSKYTSEPALSALIDELRAFEHYCHYNNLLHVCYNICGTE